MVQPEEEATVKSSGTFEPIASKPTQSLGKWMDNLLGDKRMRAKAALKTEARTRAMAEAQERAERDGR
jgi:hypothetical protein